MPAPEFALIQDAEQSVQDRGGAQEDLIQKGNFRLRQHAFGLGLDDALPELSEIDRPKNLGWLRKSADQILEIAPAKPARNSAYRFALRRARRPNHEEVLFRHRTKYHKLGQHFPLH